MGALKFSVVIVGEGRGLMGYASSFRVRSVLPSFFLIPLLKECLNEQIILPPPENEDWNLIKLFFLFWTNQVPLLISGKKFSLRELIVLFLTPFVVDTSPPPPLS